MDPDAISNNIKICEYFIQEGRKVRLLEFPNNSDINEIGFEQFWKIAHSTKNLTYKELLRHKLKYNKKREQLLLRPQSIKRQKFIYQQ